MNVNTITRFTTNNQSLGASYSAPAEIVAPRVFRVGTRIVF